MLMVNLSPADRWPKHVSYTDSFGLGLCRYMRHTRKNESLYDAEPEKRVGICAITIAYGA